jgi:transketolase C-terminal domain/subunit
MAHFGTEDNGTVMAVLIPHGTQVALIGNGILIATGSPASMARTGAALGFEVIDCVTVKPVARPYAAPAGLYW